MKIFATLAAIATLIAGISVASAAPPTEKAPASLNGAATQIHHTTESRMNEKGERPTNKVIGSSEFCAQKNGELKCTYTSMVNCHAANKANGWLCIENPSSTTGAK